MTRDRKNDNNNDAFMQKMDSFNEFIISYFPKNDTQKIKLMIRHNDGIDT